MPEMKDIVSDQPDVVGNVRHCPTHLTSPTPSDFESGIKKAFTGRRCQDARAFTRLTI